MNRASQTERFLGMIAVIQISGLLTARAADDLPTRDAFTTYAIQRQDEYQDENEAPATGAETVKVSPVITEFDQKFSYGFLAFEKTSAVEHGSLHVTGGNGQGGLGFLQKFDLAVYSDWSPAVWARVGAKNRATSVKLVLDSGNGKRLFTYPLDRAGRDSFVRILPEHGMALSPVAANEPDQSFDPANIRLFQIQGDWTGNAVDVYLDKIELVPPDDEMRLQRAAHSQQLARAAERKRQEEERRQQEIKALLAGASHPADGPEVLHVCAVTENTILLQIQAGQIVYRRPFPYQPQPGDEIRPPKPGGATVLAWENGLIVDTPKDQHLMRDLEGKGRLKDAGAFVVNQRLVAPGPGFQGVPLSVVTADQSAAYRMVSRDDPAFKTPQQPAAVYVKTKPTGQAGNQKPLRCNVYLQLPSLLKEGATYTITLQGVNTRQESVAYTHSPRHVRSEAVHVTQIGYRPGDPFKRAYLSLWMGTGGAVSYPQKRFEIIDAKSGATALTGDIRLGFAADRKEIIRGDKNQTQTNVYYLDFHGLTQPGEYCVYVPGIGVSTPFTVAEEVWERAFRTSMHGFLSHRSGIALGPPFTAYQRPRPMHPADGIKVFDLDVTYWNGEADSVHNSLRRLLGPTLDASRLTTNQQAWGGYMDAGDWDRRSQHLMSTWLHLELADLFPEFFEKLKLALPPDEAGDRLPDVINEALWNLDLYRRLQRAGGGVGGGVESTSHPRPGEASWQESLLLGTFAPDPETSLRYAACAAQAARLLHRYDPQLATTYADTAVRAWTWANANEEQAIQAETQSPTAGRNKDPETLQQAVRDMRALAAVALYRLTRDAAYHEAFRQSTRLGESGGDPGSQLESVFAYACLPDGLADAALRQLAVDWYEQAARDCLDFAANNAFNITCRVPQLPLIGYVGYYSVPETAIGAILPRAHYLTGRPQYLQGAIAATQFSAGANPMNITMTTGVGLDYPRHPLHIDSLHAGLDVPTGITVYGVNDPSRSGGDLDWAHTWYLDVMTPPSRTWPAAEFYVDLGNWPPMNEYTVHQCFGPTSYYWGYLAARGSRASR